MGRVGPVVPSRSHKHRQPEFDPQIDAQKIVLTLTLMLTLTPNPNRDVNFGVEALASAFVLGTCRTVDLKNRRIERYIVVAS